MERKVDEKLDSLEKYVPFINYLLELDENKYQKFKDIRHWILSRKRYPMNVLQKIEQSIIIQYRNLFFDDGKVPKHIMDIFNTYAHAKCYRVNLCSDDEDNVEALSNDDNDDDVVIISTTPPPSPQGIIQPLSKTPIEKFKSKGQETDKATVQPRLPIEEPICIDSDDDSVELCDIVEISDEKEEKLFKRREDFKHEIKEKDEIVNQQEKFNPGCEVTAGKDNAPQGGENAETNQSETNLENMDIDTLKSIYNELKKENGIDVEQLLESIDVTSMNSVKIIPNNVLHESNFSSPKRSIYVPTTPAPDVDTPTPQTCLYGMQPVIPVLPTHVTPGVPTAPPVLPLIPPQPVKLNLKDPRIVKLLEKNKTLQMIPPATNKSSAGSSGHFATHEPKTYGEYKRLKEEKARKVREAKREEELKRIEAAKHAEELKRMEAAKHAEQMKRLEEERRGRELQRIEEARKKEERNRALEAKEAQKLNKIEVAKATKELELVEEKEKAKELNIIEQVKKANELKAVEEISRAEAINTVEKISKTEEAKKTNKKLESNNARNNTTLSNVNSKTAPSQSTENSTSNLVLQQDIRTENADNKGETTDLRNIILNTILPYGDKILDVLRKEPTMQGLNVAELSQKEQSGKKVEPIFINQNKKLFHRHMSSESPVTVNNVPLPNQVEKGEQTPSKSKKKRRKEKEPKVKTSFKRIRTISSSSTASSTSTSSSTDLTASISHSCIQSSNSLTTDPTKHNASGNHLLTTEPMVKLRRLSPETILKYTNIRSEAKTPKTINIHLVEDTKRTKKTVHRIVEPKLAKVNLKYKNIDILMTSENTTFCVLCKSKPSDLTNHYRKVHKTESYVARLSSSNLDDLELNVTFANKVTKGAGNSKKYVIKCAFCRDDIEEKFINFYKHFSTHTGEYAFQCGYCKLEKPYEFDIQSHKCHSKTCRNAPIRTLYQYPPNVLVIYVYCCKICNFAQLNEANTFKHLRDHHDKTQDDSSYIKKYILAAINDEETCEKASELDKNFELLMRDDDILVRNEAIVEDMHDNYQVKNETDAHIKTIQCSGQQQLEDNFISTMEEVPSTSYASYLKQNILTSMPAQKNDKYTAIQIKTENQNTKPFQKDTPGSKKLTQNSCKSSYRHYPTGFSYFGLYKCMANDCLYSTDAESEILQHLNEHCNSECPPEGYLLCAYCQLDAEICNTPEKLIEHICKNHKQSQFQCSICCYRGVSPSHVLEHLKNAHPEQERELVYQCEIDCILDTKTPESLYKLLDANLALLICPLKDCSKSYLSRTWMKNHLMHAHSLPLNSDYIAALAKYACIYCTSNFHDFEVAKKHLILCHPDQQPYICDRNLLPEKEEDLVQNLTVKTVSLPIVPFEKIVQVKVKEEFTAIDKNFESQDTIDAPESLIADSTTEATNQTESEVKPNVEQLLQIAEENVRYSILKLIGGTGVTPNLLYHCPHTICGGFFSSYDLWYRHMTFRHCCIISVCPHCPNNNKEELPLVDFKEHFQQHCCHLYGCFHCGETFSSEQNCRDHLTLKHAALNPGGLAIRIEKVPLFFNQPFNVLKLKHEHEAEDRYGFLLALQEVVQTRCKYVEKQYYESLKTQWTVPFTALWLEKFPSFKINDSVKRKCLCQNCPFETFDNELFYAHLRANHRVNGNKFLCSKCDFRVTSESWEPIIDHIKMHVLDIHICTVCSYHHYDRRKLFEHLELNHRCRDVPVVTILRSAKCIQISIAIVFAQLRKTFSTTRYCFFCNEHSNQWQTYVSHLKNVHHITLQYFCEICHESLKLAECDEHFSKKHPTAALRIRAQIATNNQISVDTIMPLKFSFELNDMDRIAGQKQSVIGAYKTKVKQEPCDTYSDSDVEMITEDDIVIANDTKQQESENRNPLTMANLQNLQVPNTNFNNIQTQSPMLYTQLIAQQVTPPRSSHQSTVPNYVAPRLAIQSHNPNFSGDCNFRPVKILIRPNIGTSPS